MGNRSIRATGTVAPPLAVAPPGPGWVWPRRLASWGFFVVVVVFAIAIPAGPDSAAKRAWEERLRPFGYSQTWKMYAPDPMRSYPQLELYGLWRDGRRIPLEETALAEAGWSTGWAWNRGRRAIQRQILLRGKNRDRWDHRRAWYARAACARERARGQMPDAIEVVRARITFRHPRRVAKDRRPYTDVERTTLQTESCHNLVVTRMYEAVEPR